MDEVEEQGVQEPDGLPDEPGVRGKGDKDSSSLCDGGLFMETES